MAKKKVMQSLDDDDRRLIEEKMNGKSSSGNDSSYISYNYNVKIKCKTPAQKEFLKILKDPKKMICVGSGSAGSGKSYISLAAALQMLSKSDGEYNEIRNIVVVVPTNPAGSSTQKIGYLKGTLAEKIAPHLQADTENIIKILNNSGVMNAKAIAEGLVRNGVIKHEICSFVKGKTWDNSIILLNEAEDYSIAEMLLLCTRIGDNSQLWITGDERQCDRSDIKQSKLRMSGLEYIKHQLKYMDEFACVTFGPEDIVRNPIITKILALWDRPIEPDTLKENVEEVIEEPQKKKRGRPKKQVASEAEAEQPNVYI